MGGLIMGKLHYIGMLVDLRPASGKSYIVWDLNTNRKFANENFKSVQEAIEFCNQNRMVINMDFSQRVEVLKKIGFTETKVGMTNGKYAFLWYQIDTDEMSNEVFQEYIESI